MGAWKRIGAAPCAHGAVCGVFGTLHATSCSGFAYTSMSSTSIRASPISIMPVCGAGRPQVRHMLRARGVGARDARRPRAACRGEGMHPGIKDEKRGIKDLF
mgnify:CR=1 FL=1|jgi:hypothetical protein